MINENISLLRVFDVISEIADNHKMIEDHDVGDRASRGSSKGQDSNGKPRELNFPYLFTDVAGVDLEVGKNGSVQTKVYKINLFVADKHLDSAENDADILSDTESILSDLIMYITQNNNLREFIVGIGVTSLEPSRHTTIHEVYGFQCILSIKVKASICWNLLPFKDGEVSSDLECRDVTITFNSSSVSSVPSGGSKSIILQDTEGLPVDHLILEDIQSRLVVEVESLGAAPLNTADIFKTGAESFQTKDDGDLDQGRGVDFYTLNHLNGFGDSNRFTDKLGGQDYIDGIIIDWSTWNQIDNLVLAYSRNLRASNTLTNHIASQPHTEASYNDWTVCNYKQLVNMFNLSIFRNYLNYPPLNHNLSGSSERVWTSTRENVSNGLFYAGSSLSVSNQTGVYRALLSRTFTFLELGL